tara:strand:- start:770 stop:1582 length:813 start_codon:yes stop_codon:yes gene_type:complete
MLLYTIPGELNVANIIKRPSRLCKTPYVADICIDNQSHMGHTPSLGCCGLADNGANVIVNKIQNPKGVCSHSIQLAIVETKGQTIYVGIHTKLAELITKSAIEKNCISALQNVTQLQREKTFMNSRFDFTGIQDNGRRFILEVKSVPLADYEDITAKERNKKDYSDRAFDSKVAYFPDGYRKKKGAVVSPRALKHINELKEICLQGEIDTYMCYVIQRSDASSFQTSVLDPTYKQAVDEAVKCGVKIVRLQVGWNEKGEARFITDCLKMN